MERFKVKKRLVVILSKEIQHLNEVRELLDSIGLNKHQLRKVDLLNNLIQSTLVDVLKSFSND